MLGHKSSTGNRCPGAVALDRLSFVKNYPVELHTVQDAALLVVDLLPPLDLLFGGLTLNRRFVLGVLRSGYEVSRYP
jgi:hypothetical protein